MSMHLLPKFVSAYPAQPATAFWRAIEIGALARRDIPHGLGLDLGCGDGILTSILLETIGPRRLVGVDIDSAETAAAKKYDFYERIHTCSGSMIPEPDASFDFVISNSVLEHVENLEATIAEAARLLRPNGRFFFTVPGPGFHDNLAGSLMPLGKRSHYLASIDRRLAHRHYLSADDWTALCKRNGLTLEFCLGYLNRVETQRWETLSRITGGLLYTLGGKRGQPIDIQRRLGMRSLQNRLRLPQGISGVLSRAIGAGIFLDSTLPTWLDPGNSSCLLVEGSRA